MNGYYQVSNLGRVKSFPRLGTRTDEEYIMIGGINRKHYSQVLLTKNGESHSYRIHRLVAKTFIPNPNNLPQVNHKDGNKQNNAVSNLEWINNYDNMQHSIKTGLRDINKIAKILSNVNKRSVNQYDLSGNFIKTWDSIKSVEKELNISNQNICKVCQGRRNKAGGYIWKYVD